MLKRLIGIFAIFVVVLCATGAYLLYAPTPALPSTPAETLSVRVGGRERQFLVVSPPDLHVGASILLAMHPSQSNGVEMRRMVGTTLEGMARRDNTIVVYPDGYEGHFNDCRRVASYSARTLNIDDVAFAKHIVDRLVAEKQADPGRVYAIGYSNGGQMALRLALEVPEMVRGVAAIAANLPTSGNMDCKVAPTPSRYIDFIAGTSDPINPYEGGPVSMFGFGNRGDVLSAPASAQWFAERLGVTSSESGTLGTDGVGLVAQRQDWRSANAHVRLVTIEGGGHVIPQSRHRYMRLLGATFQRDLVLESTWNLLTEAATVQN